MTEQINDLIIQRANFDGWFSKFLDNNKSKMTEENYDTQEWKEYRKALGVYGALNRQIKVLTYNSKQGHHYVVQ